MDQTTFAVLRNWLIWMAFSYMMSTGQNGQAEASVHPVEPNIIVQTAQRLAPFT